MPYKVIIFKTDGTLSETIQPKAPEYNQLREAVGGFIETVPYFKKYKELSRGTAYCNENGIAERLRYNTQASEAWRASLKGPYNRDMTNLHGNVIFYAKVK